MLCLGAFSHFQSFPYDFRVRVDTASLQALAPHANIKIQLCIFINSQIPSSCKQAAQKGCACATKTKRKMFWLLSLAPSTSFHYSFKRRKVPKLSCCIWWALSFYLIKGKKRVETTLRVEQKGVRCLGKVLYFKGKTNSPIIKVQGEWKSLKKVKKKLKKHFSFGEQLY